MTDFTEKTRENKFSTDRDSNSKRDKLMTGLFNDKDSAENAYKAALSRGYTRDDINIMMSDETRKKYFNNKSNINDEDDLGTKSLEGLGVGGAIGGAVGGIVGAVAAIGTSLVIPGLGLVVAGPLAAALAGIGAGGLTGGIIGTLVGWGIPEEKAKLYQDGIKSGGIVVGVKSDAAKDTKLESDWKTFNANHLHR